MAVLVYDQVGLVTINEIFYLIQKKKGHGRDLVGVWTKLKCESDLLLEKREIAPRVRN